MKKVRTKAIKTICSLFKVQSNTSRVIGKKVFFENISNFDELIYQNGLIFYINMLSYFLVLFAIIVLPHI